ncbi:copper resistance CopC family protein [Methylocystis parvus]|uniref:Copper resistance protein CopC n=1 Tax=Methylocystis parvus TaxID=134 RepID=A0A6B8M326_9HYPH|nr:copper resistance CopC family protein [Methylocystis parvus]QGM98244.1 copper resistance protein CopC [Methylocystis parvus]WBK01430.1 copper resistance protein CopC [Methylocystis parvus OBBP]
MKLFRFLGVCALAALISGSAWAHALVVASFPRSEETIKSDEIAIEIRFNSRIDAERSTMKLFKIDGAVTALPILDAGSADTLKARATGLTAGRYRLHWQTLSPDGHITQGDIPFVVNR